VSAHEANETGALPKVTVSPSRQDDMWPLFKIYAVYFSRKIVMKHCFLDKSPGCQDGFTMIEIMIAITVFAIGITAINMLQTTSIKGNSAARWITGRTNWATYKMEELEQNDYATTDNGTANSTDTAYTATWTVQNNTPITGTKTITMTVTNKGKVSQKPTVFTWIKPKL